MNKYDTIEEVRVAKSFDEIIEVAKFNPFHDARGRFSDKNGYKTYSANPKMRAAQPSIMRSAQAGYGRTPNVHSESQGENVNQNYDWLTGQPFNKPQTATPAASKPKNTKPKTKPDDDNQSDDDKLKQQGKQPERKVVEGRDLVAEKGADAVKNMTIDEILAEQGMNNLPNVEQSEANFDKLVKTNGNVLVRSWDAYGNDADALMAAYDDQLKNGDFFVKCDGGNAMGRGMYTAVSTTDKRTGEIAYDDAFWSSNGYGDWHVNMTLDKSAKVIDLNDARKMAKKDGFHSDTWSDSDTVNDDIGAYAAAKGYDAIIRRGKTGTLADNPGLMGDYLVVLNRSKVTVFGKSGKDDAGDLRHSTSMVSTGFYGNNGKIIVD